MVTSPVGLEGAIILLVVGIILWAVSRYTPAPISTVLFWIGIIMIILGIIFLAIVLINMMLFVAPAIISALI